MTDDQTTFARATLEYDQEHELALLDAIMQAILETSTVSDVSAIVLRTGEATRALLMALTYVLALSPSISRSPPAIRKIVDEFGKHLRIQVASAEQNPGLKDVVRRSFRNTDEGGNA